MKAPLILSLALCLVGCGVNRPLQPQPLVDRVSVRSDAGMRAGVVVLRKLRFKKLDVNESGDLTRGEASDRALLLPGVVSGFADYDTDGNGRITLIEFLRDDVIQWWINDLRPTIRDFFLQADRDRDGVLKGKEAEKFQLFLSFHPELNGGDLDGNGAISLSEYEDAYMVALPDFQGGGTDAVRLPKG